MFLGTLYLALMMRCIRKTMINFIIENSLLLAVFLMSLALFDFMFLLSKGWRFTKGDYDVWFEDCSFIIKFMSIIVFAVGIGGRHKAKRGHEGGAAILIICNLTLLFWRDPYRSENSSDYNFDILHPEEK